MAIASCPDKVNFGSVLQSWALERAISQAGYDALTIDKSALGTEIGRNRRSYYLEHLLDIDLYRAKAGFVRHRLKQRVDRGFGSKMALRREAFSSFIGSNFDFLPTGSTFDDLADSVSGCDAVVVGSDQLWLPVNIAGGYFTLEWVCPPARKISYSTSFGVSELPERYMRRTGEFLSDFSAISVREETGADLVERATGARPAVVCDPTMLLRADDYRMISRIPTDAPEGRYVFCYFLGRNLWNRECAAELARSSGCQVVCIAHPDEYVAYDDGYADVYPWDAGPAEWLGLLAGAAFVCTDSFHGTVFSNLFHVPYFTFRRHERMGCQSTNSRLDTLLGRLGAAGRLCSSPEAFRSAMWSSIDWGAIDARAEAFRSESFAFLEAALSGDGAR